MYNIQKLFECTPNSHPFSFHSNMYLWQGNGIKIMVQLQISIGDIAIIQVDEKRLFKDSKLLINTEPSNSYHKIVLRP